MRENEPNLAEERRFELLDGLHRRRFSKRPSIDETITENADPGAPVQSADRADSPLHRTQAQLAQLIEAIEADPPRTPFFIALADDAEVSS
jgi:hypothetical protein